MESSELKEIYCGRSVAEASLISQMLETCGIRTQVINSTLQNAVGELPFLSVAPRIWCRSEDSDRARELIRRHFRSEASSLRTEDWECDRCSEMNGPAFEYCWHCTYPRDQSEQPHS